MSDSFLTQLFHAFRVVYTVKELDSHAKHGHSFKYLPSGFVQVSESFFFDHGSCYYGHFSRKNTLVHVSTVARASFIRLHCCTGLAREVFGVVRDMKDAVLLYRYSRLT